MPGLVWGCLCVLLNAGANGTQQVTPPTTTLRVVLIGLGGGCYHAVDETERNEKHQNALLVKRF